MKQRTIRREVHARGKTLHTGQEVQITIKPAPENHGVVFCRTDLYGKPTLSAHIKHAAELVRSTCLSSGYTKVEMTEHLLSAIHGLGIDNVLVEVDGPELPIFDGSAQPYVQLILEGEPLEQEAEREYLVIEQPCSMVHGNRSLVALPYDGLKITCTSSDSRDIHTQHLSLDIDTDTYATLIAPARTFTIYEEIEELLKMGKIRGGSLDCAVVIKGDKVMSKDGLRFKDEMVRHKILDLLGDIFLVGKPIKGHFVALLPGHSLNAQLTRSLWEGKASISKKSKDATSGEENSPVHRIGEESSLDIRRVMDLLPHRYPFILIDRVISFEGDNELTALKNVTINEPFFQGHYPGQPVMPGVLQIEAMAQAAGILMLRKISGAGKVALFMSCDKVKFRKVVTPGDQLEIKVKMIKERANRLGVAEAQCLVNGKVVSSAELMFSIVSPGS